jgi:CheY-like chemotaxis protein
MRKVLVVDDESQVLNVSSHLIKRCGYETLEAIGGQEAIDIFSEHSDEIQLIVVDYIMPEINGLDVYNYIRNVSSNIPIVFISGYELTVIGSELARVDKNIDLLCKPYSIDTLSKVLSKYSLERNCNES